MEILALVLFVILFFLILSFKSSVNANLEKLSRDVWQMKDELIRLRQSTIQTPPAPPVASPAPEKIKKDYWETSFQPADPPAEKTIVPGKIIAEPAPVFEKIEPATVTETIIVQETITEGASKKLPPAPPVATPGFFERHPDLEKFIGENLINKIGIAILVLAIGFFVKYAIDNNWIGPVGRTGIGILCGAILTALAHRLRVNYKGFSSVLAGGGLAIFYFTITLAYHQFHLFEQVTSFIIMIVITAFAVALSLLYDKQELAIIALVGGFATPFMVSNGSGDYKTLFTYLLVLNTGLLIMAFYKAWRLLNLLSFIFTIVLFAGWITTLPDNSTSEPYRNGLWFATAFFLLFFIINIANNIKENKRFIASDFGILLANTSLYFAAGLYLVDAMQANQYRGLFSASMGIFNLGASYLLFRRQQVDKNILYLLIGITLSFVSLTAPLQLHGNHITLFWASETVLLFWLYQRSGIGIIRYSSLIIWVAMLVSLLMDWVFIYSNSIALPILVNKGFITGLYTAIASYVLSVLVKKNTGNDMGPLFPGFILFKIVALVIAFTTGLLEINYQFSFHYLGTTVNIQYILLYTYLFALTGILVAKRLNSIRGSWQPMVVAAAACLLLYMIFIQNGFLLLQQVLTQKQYVAQFNAHWVSDLLIAVLFFLLVNSIRKHLSNSQQLPLVSWLMCSWVVIFISAETQLLSNQLFYKDEQSWHMIGMTFSKTALPILWGLCSFAFMWLGMRHKFRTLRIISLVLFSITLVKLFVYDIRNIAPAGKIAAFFCLGVLLLVISFMYQRLKRIIIEDEKKTDA